MKESNDNKRSKIILSEDIEYTWLTLKELTIIIWEYIREKYLKKKNINKPTEDIDAVSYTHLTLPTKRIV